MNNKTFDTDKYPDFANENSGVGTLKIQAFIADQAYPVENVDIEISKEINGDKVTFFTGKTNSSGIIDDIYLPAKPAKDNVESVEDITYTTYNIKATGPRTKAVREYEISIFDGMKVIQSVKFPIVGQQESDNNEK